MKKSHRFLIFLVLAIGAFVALVGFQANRLLRSPQVQELLIQKIQNALDGTVHYEGLTVGFSPQPVITLVRPRLAFSNQALTLGAEKMEFDFEIIPMIFGRVEPSSMAVLNGAADTNLPWFPFLGELALRNFTLKMGALRPNLAVPLQFVSDVGDQKRAVFLKGHFVTPETEKIDWNKTSCHFLAEIKGLALAGVKKAEAGADSFFVFKKGTLNASAEIKKKRDDGSLEIAANGNVNGISYEVLQDKTWITPPVFDATWVFSGTWSAAGEELKIQSLTAQLPFGGLDVNGGFRLGTGEISKLHVAASGMALEDLLKYWPRFEDALPFHIGFSGPCDWVLSVEGTLDHLSLHLNLDLTKTLLSYGTYFAKPKDVALTATLDYLIQKGATLSGDFSIRFQGMSLKGNLTGLDMANGSGQLNLITNKFSISGWEQYIPALAGYKIEGDAKALADWKGDLRRLEKAEQIFHVNIEKGNLVNAKGVGLKNVDLAFDYSPLMFEGREMRLDIGGTPVVVDAKITDLGGVPDANVKVVAGELVPVKFWDDVTALFPGQRDKASQELFDEVKNSILAVFPRDQKAKDVSLELHYLNKKLEIQRFQTLVYGGSLDLKGSADFSASPAKYQCKGEVKGVDFDSFLNRAGGQPKRFEGSLVLTADLKGSGWGAEAWRKDLKGEGRFTLTGGKSPVLDMVPPLLTLAPFAALVDKVQSLDSFEMLDFSWNLANGQVSTKDFLIKGPDHIVDGEGTIDFDGLVNFRWDVFLPTALAAEIFPEMASVFRNKSKAHFGPVPVLVAGPIATPELKPDPAQVGDLVKKIEQKKAKSLLYELVLN
jgi:hypothetical protein